jgi:hypothetical protein
MWRVHMGSTPQQHAREGRAAYYAKYKEDDIHEAASLVERFLKNPMMWKDDARNEAERQKAEDALKYVLAAWNVEFDENAEGICATCGESCVVEDQKWVHRDELVEEEADHLAEPEEG